MYIYIILYFIWWSKLIPNHYGGLRIKRIADYERTLRSVSDSRVKVKASVRLNTGSFEKYTEAAWNVPAFPRMSLFSWLCILKVEKTGSFEKCMEAAWNASATENYFPRMSLFLWLCILKVATTGSFEKRKEAAWNAPAENSFLLL